MGARRIAELKQKLEALNASIARLAAIGAELSENLAAAETRKLQTRRSAGRRKKFPGK